MAPLFEYLHLRKVILCFFICSLLFVPSYYFLVFVSFLPHTQPQKIIHPTTILLGRRNLLQKTKDLQEVDEDLVLPKRKITQKPIKEDDGDKKKINKSSSKDEILTPNKKKMKSSTIDEDEAKISSKNKTKPNIPNIPRSKTGSGKGDEQILANTKKKKSSMEEEVVASKKKKDEKKKSLSQEQEKEALPKKKKSLSTSSQNQTKLIKPKTSSTNKNQTKLNKPASATTSDSSKKKTDDDLNPGHSKTKNSKTSNSNKPIIDSTIKKSLGSTKTNTKSKNTKQGTNTKSPPSWMYQQQDDDNEDQYDLISEFRDLPTKFQQAFIPDMHRISTTSKIYLNQANKHITKGFKPYVGYKNASLVATTISFAFIIAPLLLVSLIYNKIKAYFSIQRLIIFIQIYLSIYFSILCLSSLITGLEPLRFFYATSQSTYIWLQVLQTLGYVMYLLLLLMYLVLVFSTESGLGQKLLGLAQTIVGFAIGLHYYMKVFHRVVLHQPPKTNWKVHGIYAICFMVVCLLAQAERRKKAYLEEGGQEGKRS